VQHDHLVVARSLDDAGAAHLLNAGAVVTGADGAVDVVGDAVAFFEGLVDASGCVHGALRIDRCDTRMNALFDWKAK
jgi:hypothetical protein